MARYIDLDEAIKTAINSCVKVVGHGITQFDAMDIVDAMESIPTADVVPREMIKQIFEEIDEFVYRYMNDVNYSGGDIIYDLAELKKKYLGEQSNDRRNN